jgi:hypothetical protein
MAYKIDEPSKELYEELGEISINGKVSLTALAESLANIRSKFACKNTEVEIKEHLWASRAKWCPSLASWAQTAHNLLDHSLYRCFEYWLLRISLEDGKNISENFDAEMKKLKGWKKREFLHDFTNKHPNVIFKIIKYIIAYRNS